MQWAESAHAGSYMSLSNESFFIKHHIMIVFTDVCESLYINTYRSFLLSRRMFLTSFPLLLHKQKLKWKCNYFLHQRMIRPVRLHFRSNFLFTYILSLFVGSLLRSFCSYFELYLNLLTQHYYDFHLIFLKRIWSHILYYSRYTFFIQSSVKKWQGFRIKIWVFPFCSWCWLRLGGIQTKFTTSKFSWLWMGIQPPIRVDWSINACF